MRLLRKTRNHADLVGVFDRTLAEVSALTRPMPPSGAALLFWGKAAEHGYRALSPRNRVATPVLVIASKTERPSSFPILSGEHPLPGPGSFEAGRRLLDFFYDLRRSRVKRLEVYLSGGASSLAWLPPWGVSAEALARRLRRLYSSPLPIAELNRRRSELCLLKNGGALRILRELAPKVLVHLNVVSDVLPYGPEVVGSGPFRGAKTTVLADNRALIERLGGALGCESRFLSPRRWEDWVSEIVRLARSRRSQVLGGEPLVALPRGLSGSGGRQSHLAASLALELREPLARGEIELLCASSDGLDGNSGARAFWLRREQGRRLLEGPAEARHLAQALRAYDTAPALARLGALLPARPSGTNVQDALILTVS